MIHLLLFLFMTFSARADDIVFNNEFLLTSNSIWRGITFSNNHPALNAELGVEYGENFFLTNYGTADFSDVHDGRTVHANQSLDLTVGRIFTLKDTLKSELAYTYSVYPGAEYFNSQELEFRILQNSFFLGATYMDRYFGANTTYATFQGGVEYEWKPDQTLNAAVGFNLFSKNKDSDPLADKDSKSLRGAGSTNYWNVLLSYVYEITPSFDLDVSVNWTNRYVYESDEKSGFNRKKAYDDAIVGSLLFSL